MTTEPSTAWREDILPDEEARYARYAEIIGQIQKRREAQTGKGRTLHLVSPLALRGRFEVLPDLPAYARHGLFAEPRSYDARVRLSNGAGRRQPDKAPDVRGFAIKVEGVKGPSALGDWDTESQDFLLINHESFSSPKSEEFIGIVEAVSRGPAALLGHLIKTQGFFKGLGRAGALIKGLKRPFSGFATMPFYSAAPIAVGPYAARVRLQPASDRVTPGAERAWADDVKARLQAGPLVHDLQLQFFTDEASTPIEDASRSWTSPYVTVARLTVQEAPADAAFVEAVEKGAFDPWNALKAHRPLGDVMRARKAAYYTSQQGRA